MIFRLRIWIVIACIGGSCEVVAAREWELKGKPFEAELVDVDGRIAQFRESDGRIVGHHESLLADADRKYIADWLATERRERSNDEIGVTAFSYWEKIQYLNYTSPPQIVLVVLLKVHGRDAAAAAAVRDLKLEAVADDETRLELSRQTPGNGGQTVRLARCGTLEQPSWGYKLKLIWKAPEKPIALLRLAGSMKIVTGIPRSFAVDGLGKQKNREVESPLLKQTGLKMIENPWPRSSGVFFPEAKENPTTYFLTVDGPAAHVHAVEMLDATEQLIEEYSGRSFVGNSWRDKNSNAQGETGTFQFEFYPPLPDNPKLRITVLERAHEVAVPFELTDVAVPKNRPTLEEKKQGKEKPDEAK